MTECLIAILKLGIIVLTFDNLILISCIPELMRVSSKGLVCLPSKIPAANV